MNKVICHQYATGRGTTGYGFIAYSKEKETDVNASFSFSLNKCVGLRFARLSAESDYVLEIDPVTTDYQYTGAFYTTKRVEAGSSSIYTHVLICNSNQLEAHNALGLLKVKNFLTPEGFSDIVYGKSFLRIEEKDNTLATRGNISLNSSQEKTLGEFLAKYWKLLEQREWSGKKEELALVLPGKTILEKIEFFSDEIVCRLPEQLRPAISVSFGTQWENRGSTPCVCCVLSDIQDNPFPFYDVINGRTGARKADVVEERIGQLLVQNHLDDYPETYRRILKLGASEEQFRKMARGYSVLAYCVNADLETGNGEDCVAKKKQAYEKLIELAEKRYGISRERAQHAFLPLLLDTFRTINNKKNASPEEISWMIEERINLHLSELTKKESLEKHDQMVTEVFHTLNRNDMVSVIEKLWTNLRQKGKTTEECFALIKPFEQGLMEKHREPGCDPNSSVLSALKHCNRLINEVGEEASSITQGYKQWLCTSENRELLLDTLGKWQIVEKIKNSLFFDLIEGIDINECKDEKDIVKCLNVIRCAKQKDLDRAEAIWGNTFPAILKNAVALKKCTDDGFTKIADYILEHTLSEDTIILALDFALGHQECKGSSGYFSGTMEKILQNNAVNKQEIQDELFVRLEAAPDHFSASQYVDRLLEISNNRIPENLVKYKKLQGQRLQKGIDSFVHTVGIKKQTDMSAEWDRGCAGRYGCSWNQLTEEQLIHPVQDKLLISYIDSQDKVRFLDKSWTIAVDSGENSYGNVMKKVVTELIGKEYDKLWRQDGMDPAGQETEDCRNILDRIVDNCGMRAKCDSTGAGKARIFLDKVRELDRKDLQPTEAGKLLQEYKAGNYTDYIRINQDFFKSRKTDDESVLIKKLFQALSIKYDMKYDYWETVLEGYGVQLTRSWNENDHFRTLNIMSFITHTLERMAVPELQTDLKDYYQQHGYEEILWDKSFDEQVFKGEGARVLSESLYQWLGI